MVIIGMYKRYYFENAILCGNCNGTGLQGHLDYCRMCGGLAIDTFEIFKSYHKGDLISLRLQYNDSLKWLQR